MNAEKSIESFDHRGPGGQAIILAGGLGTRLREIIPDFSYIYQ